MTTKQHLPKILTAAVVVNLALTGVLGWKMYKHCSNTPIGNKNGAVPAIGGQNIGVINVEEILAGSEAAKSINKQVETLRTDFQKWGEGKEKTLGAMEANLVKELPKLTEAQSNAKRQELEKNIAEFQREAMDKKQKMEAATHEGVDQIKQQIVAIATKLATEKGMSHVMANTFLVYYDQTSDLTNDVLPALNKSLSSVKVEVKSEPKKA